MWVHDLQLARSEVSSAAGERDGQLLQALVFGVSGLGQVHNCIVSKFSSHNIVTLNQKVGTWTGNRLERRLPVLYLQGIRITMFHLSSFFSTVLYNSGLPLFCRFRPRVPPTGAHGANHLLSGNAKKELTLQVAAGFLPERMQAILWDGVLSLIQSTERSNFGKPEGAPQPTKV